MGSAHCIHRMGRAFRVCSVLRLRPREPPPPPPPAAPSPGSAWTLGPHTVSLRPPGPHRAPPLILPSHFQWLKNVFSSNEEENKEETPPQSSIHGERLRPGTEREDDGGGMESQIHKDTKPVEGICKTERGRWRDTEKPFPAAGLGLRVGPGIVLGGARP